MSSDVHGRARPLYGGMPPSLVLAGAALLVGCGGGGDGPGTSAYDYQGFWLMTSWTMDFGGTIDTLTRDGMPIGLLGDALFTATSATTGDLSVRFAGVQDDVLTAAPTRSDGTVVVEEGKWIVSDENDPLDPADDTVSVFTVTVAGGILTLDVDPSDPRHVDSGGPLQITLERHTPWGATATGSWEVATWNLGSGSVDPGACTMVGPGNSTRISVALAIDDRWMIDQTSTTNTYVAADCSSVPVTTVRDLVGYAEEEGTELRLWVYDGVDPAGSGYLVFDMAPTGIADLTLTRTSCGPTAFCTSAPLELVLQPMP